VDNCVELDAPVETLNPAAGLRAVTAKGKPSKSRFRQLVYETETDTSLVSCSPVTGRGHQLRVHLQFLGHPIVDDRQYGGSSMTNNKKELAVQEIMKSIFSGEDAKLESVSCDEHEAAKDVCRCCSRGEEGILDSFTPAQLLESGHAISLHALQYEITFPENKKAKKQKTPLKSELATLQMQVTLPEWAHSLDSSSLNWL
jgi:hypothetical protein